LNKVFDQPILIWLTVRVPPAAVVVTFARTMVSEPLLVKKQLMALLAAE
jgi:hypothetical protein